MRVLVLLATAIGIGASAYAASPDVQVTVQKKSDGTPNIIVEANGPVITLQFHTDVTEVRDDLSPLYFFLSTGVVIDPAPSALPAGCSAYPYEQVSHSPGATHMDFFVTLQGQSCSHSTALFVGHSVGLSFDSVLSGTGDSLGTVSVGISP